MGDMKNLAYLIAAAGQAGRELQDICHERARDTGWWTNLRTDQLFTHEEVRAMIADKLWLVNTELCEGYEGHRKGKMDDHLPHREALEVEMADAVIRLFDLAGALKYDIGGAIAEKLSYNATRKDHTLAARRAPGGKKI